VNRKLVYIAGGILVLGGAVIAFLLLLPGGVTFLDSAPPPAPEEKPRPLTAIQGPDGRFAVQVPEMTVPAPAPVYEPAPPPPPPNTWEAVKPAAKLASLGRIGAAVARGLNEMKDEMDVCFDEDVQSQHGRNPVSRSRDAAPISDEVQATIVMLHIEGRYGSVVIVDAPVETQGTASDGLVACAQRVLRGLEFQTPDAAPGQRFRVPYMLSQ